MVLWTPEHIRTLLPAIFVMLAIGVVLRLLLIKKELKYRMIPLQVVTVILLLLEIGKQVVSYSRGYDLYHIPLHFCSILLVTLPAMAFYRGKHASMVRAIGTATCGAVFWLTAIYPDLIYGAGNITNFFQSYLDFHTVAFHNLAMLAFVLIVALELHKPQRKGEFKNTIIFLTVFCLIAAVVSQLLETNYAGFYHCNVAPIEQIRLDLQPVIGYWPAQLIYVVGLMVVHYGFVCGFYALYKLLNRLLNPKKELTAV